MKFSAVTWTLIVQALSCYSQELKIGDNLFHAFQKINPVPIIEFPPMSAWIDEQRLSMMASEEKGVIEKTFFIGSSDKIWFAVFYHRGDSSYYLLDFDMDSILDTRSTWMYMPFELVRRKSRILPSDTTVLGLLNYFYLSTLQADDNITLDTAKINLLNSFYKDSSLNNRHLIYLFTTYQYIISAAAENKLPVPVEITVPLINALAEECLIIYNTIPAIVRIYRVEALLNAASKDLAKVEVASGLENYPECIPLKVYDFKLETDKTLKAAKLFGLKTNHPSHWMVIPLTK